MERGKENEGKILRKKKYHWERDILKNATSMR